MSSSVRMAVLKRRELAKQVEYKDKKKINISIQMKHCLHQEQKAQNIEKPNKNHTQWKYKILAKETKT